MRRFKVNLAAGQMVPLSVRGDYVRVIMSDGELKIEPNNSQSLQGMTKGMAYTAPVTFNELKLTSDIDQQVELMAGVGKIEDNRATINGTIDVAGVVSVVNGGRVSVNNEVAFIYGGYRGPSASNYSYLQLKNPAGSGKNLIVEFIRVSATESNIVSVGAYSGVLSEATALDAANKKINGVDSVGKMYAEASSIANIAGVRFFSFYGLSAYETESHKFEKPLIVPPGESIVARCNVVNAGITVDFEYVEEPV